MKTVGLVGWRGMVGSVLLERMRAENDFDGSFEPVYFSTSQSGQDGPDGSILLNAYDISALSKLDIVLTCQGGEYTNDVYPKLRNAGWSGYWIDAASALRMKDHAIIVLDPVNRNVIDTGLASGIKDYIGGNCTVSLMLMALSGLFKEGLIEWLTSMTYQAASGAGAKYMIELMAQMAGLAARADATLSDPASTALELEAIVTNTLRDGSLPVDNFGVPLAASLIPWIDKPMENGQTREEWKGFAETNKILQPARPIPVDGLCVRIGAMRCHSQALTIKLTRDVPLDELIAIIGSGNQWVKVIPNDKQCSIQELTPTAISGKLDVAIGRIRKMEIGPEYLTAFTVGDQLLWGAAEPLRRILRIILEYK